MISRRPLLLSLPASLALALPRARAQPAEALAYLAGPDFQPFAGPRGSFSAAIFNQSRIYPGLKHWWAIYTPAPEFVKSPPALMVFQDGFEFTYKNGAWHTPTVLDNLIAQKAIPPMVAIFVNPGRSPEDPTDREAFRTQRSLEYDTLSPLYSRFLLEEILPLARTRATWTEDPNLHATGGHSSGAICAFTVAWDNPDQFRKVYSANGSFTGIRGGNAYPAIVRAGPKRPLRIYMWSDTHDMSRPDWGDWATANKAMAAALQQEGYDLLFQFGEGTHQPYYAAARFPAALRWLWR